MKESNEIQVTHSFTGLLTKDKAKDGIKRQAHVWVGSDGCVSIRLETYRTEDPFVTPMRLSKDSFSLLYDVLFEVAHNLDDYAVKEIK